MQKIIECVPNFSEGRDKRIIELITNEIRNVDGVQLLDIDSGADMNRTVVTFVGEPGAVEEAAFRAIKKASELIDMAKHKGSHPRIGATDVCPFIPVSNVSEQECIELSRRVAKRVGEELGIPVFLYEKSATKKERKNLEVIRKGEYEGLKEKLKDPKWKPDFGPAKFNPKTGATVIGVREFLIAYNINLNTREVKYATDIAFELREKGRTARYGNIHPFYFKGEIKRYKESHFPCGNCEFVGKTIDETIEHCKKEHNYDLKELLILNGIDPENTIGKPVKKPGKFKYCKAIGWSVPAYDCVQISINLTNYKITPIHLVYEEAIRLADERGIRVTGSEIVGMVPFDALLETGKYYLQKQGCSSGIPVRDILETAVQSLGLRDKGDFIIEKRVLGFIGHNEEELVSKKVYEFVDEVSRKTPAPGGGSVSALSGSLGAALSSMVANLSTGKKEEIDKILISVAEKSQEIKEEMIKKIDEDTRAFNNYINSVRVSKKQEEKVREEKIQNALKNVIEVPISVMEKALEGIKNNEKLVEHGISSALSDTGCAYLSFYSAFYGAYLNVLINLKNLKEKKEYIERVEKLEKEFKAFYEKNFEKIFKNLKGV